MCCMMMHAIDHSARYVEHGHAHMTLGEPLLEILKRRYTLGEITRAQLEEMRVVLGLSTGPSIAEAPHHGSTLHTLHLRVAPAMREENDS